MQKLKIFQRFKINGGAEVYVRSGKIMHQIGLKMSGLSKFKAKLSSNSLVKHVGVVKSI